MGGVGSRVVFWTWPALEAACARVCMCALVLVPGVGAGARHSWCIVVRMRKLPLATVTCGYVCSLLQPSLAMLEYSVRAPFRVTEVKLALLAAARLFDWA